MPDKIVNHFVLADGSTAKYDATQLAGDVPEVVGIRTGYDGAEYASAGDAVRGQVNNLEKELTELYTGSFEVTDIIQGSYNSAGQVLPKATRIRSRSYIRITKGDIVHFTSGTNVASMFIGYFDANKNFIADSAWYSRDIVAYYSGYIIIQFKNATDTNITPEEYDATTTITRMHSFDTVASDMDLYAGNTITKIPPRNCLSFYFDGDGCAIEESSSSLYIKTSPQFCVRAGINGVNTDVAYTKYRCDIFQTPSGNRLTWADSLGTALVTSPNGLQNCIEIPEYNSLVFDMTEKKVVLVSRLAIKKDQIPLATNRNGKPSYLHPYFLKIYTDQKVLEAESISENDGVLTAIKNARHIPNPTNDTAPALTIAHFSDIHGDTAALGRITNKLNALSDYIDDVICTGDIAPSYGTEIASWWNPSYMTVIGNHDAATVTDGAWSWNGLTMAQKVAWYISPFESNWNITRDSGKSYYYKDYSNQNVRLIVLDAQLNYTGITPEGGTAEMTAQTSWLSGLLSDAITNGLHVLIAIHAPVNNAPIVDCHFSRYGRTNMASVTDSFTPTEIFNAVSTAIGNGLNFVGYIVGHYHQDYIYKPATGQLGYCITCATTNYAPNWDGSDQFRDSTLDAINLVTIDTSNKLVKIVRAGGANIDDLTRPREGITFSYASGEIVGEIK